MFRKEILSIFFENLKVDESGRYLIELGPERCYLDVEDTAFVVLAVYKTQSIQDGREQLEIVLNDDCSEILDVRSLYVGKDNVLYGRVKQGKFIARFTRKAYYQIAEFIEQTENGNGFFIDLNSEKYFINDSQAH
jgi:uncharacterized protein